MKLLSVNLAMPRAVDYQGRSVMTGIYKEPVTGPVQLHHEGLEGDGQADLKVHGGPDKAAYAYPIEHYAWWQEQLGRASFPHGQFGETLTVQGLLEHELGIGDCLRIGGALLQVSQPRTPCFKLGIKMGLEDFPRTFQDSGRVGFYLRVLEKGPVCAGDGIEIVSRHEPWHSVQELWRWNHVERNNRDAARIAVALAPLAQSWKDRFAQRLR
ncbi:MAG: MOSC domain-containing protein [Gammaproteobacteria bacterium]